MGLDPFLTAFHELNLPKNASDRLIGTYLKQVEQVQAAAVEAQDEADSQAKDANTEALRDEWGADFKRNNTVLKNFVGTLPEAVRDAFDKGRGPDGVPLGYNTEVVKWLVGQALEANPLATVVPGAGAQAASAIDDEIKQIETTMRTNRAAYNKDEKMQTRYRELIDARLKMKEQK